jgi:dipeptidyl aminopeptidase/acylaminoacyl peptidase
MKRATRPSRALLLSIAGAASVALMSGQAAQGAERAPHAFLEVAISPDGVHVASVEGDSPESGGRPVVRSLIIRGVHEGSAVVVDLPCGTAPECWPASPAWSSDGKTLVFALRKPGSHARSVYRVRADGTELTELLAFQGTITQLRYGPTGRLALLAVANATKEVGAIEAGAPITGDQAPAPRQRPAPQTQEFWHALRDLSVPTSYAIYPGEGHHLIDPAHIADAQARTLAWFDKYLR